MGENTVKAGASMISWTRAPTGPEVTISLSGGASRRPQSDWLLGSGYCTGVDFKDSQGAQGSAGLLIYCRRHHQALTLPALMCGCCSLLWAVSCLSMLVAPCSCSGPSGSVQLSKILPHAGSGRGQSGEPGWLSHGFAFKGLGVLSERQKWREFQSETANAKTTTGAQHRALGPPVIPGKTQRCYLGWISKLLDFPLPVE